MTLDPLQLDSILNLRGGARMLDAVREGLRDATEARIAVSFTRCSGLGLLLDPLRAALARSSDVRLLTSTYMGVTQPEALRTLLGLPGLQSRVHRVEQGQGGLHAKFWWFGRREGATCWVGSSNLTKGGLTSNLEWNLRREDAAAAELTKSQFDELWASPDVSHLNDLLIDQYAAERRAQGLDLPPKRPLPSPGTVHANEAQKEALAKLTALRAQGLRRAAVIAATGVGKTYLAAMDARNAGAQRVLYVSHRMEHLEQARRSFRMVWGEPLRAGLLGDGVEELEGDHLFATIQSLSRRPALLDQPWDYLVIDEFHHAEARSYRILRELRDRAFLLGLTATPERMDGRDVLEWCDHTVAYELRLPEAIERSLLLPFHYFGIADSTLEMGGKPWRWTRIEDEEARLCAEERVDLILKHALERGFDGPRRAAVAFCAGVRHAKFMAEAFRTRGQEAATALGEDSPSVRRALCDRLVDPTDPLEWLFVADVLNEGVDVPGINVVLFLRPTESATVFLQQLGRGLRRAPGVEVLTVLDFVGHHQQAWVALNALDAPAGAGRWVEVVAGQGVRPPADCEILLDDRTEQILQKVRRYGSQRELAKAVYTAMRAKTQAGDAQRRPTPADLWARPDLPNPRDVVQAHEDWLGLQEACGDAPAWAQGLNPAVRSFLRKVEKDWQYQRVTPYALIWGMCAQPEDPQQGYVAFFQRHPEWTKERLEPDQLATSTAAQRVATELADALDGGRLSAAVRDALGEHLLPEVEGRLQLTLQKDLRDRYSGVLRRPEELVIFERYTRPEIVQHFNKQYDPAVHNAGVLRFPDGWALICKIDTSTAVAQHQYENALLDTRTFSWTSQKRLSPTTTTGRALLEAAATAGPVHLFVQPRSRTAAYYLGPVRAGAVEGANKMRVVFHLTQPVRSDIAGELQGGVGPS
jgi:superfamily II DNA or RNA helicase/HKD family nuclease